MAEIAQYRAPGSIVKAGAVGVVTLALLAFMGRFEGERYQPYQDPAVPGLWTVCKGITNRAAPGWVVPGKLYSVEECQAKEAELIDTVFAPRIASCTRVDLTQRQWEMLIDFGWNAGVANLCGSTLMRKLNAGDCAGAAGEFERWVQAGGRKWPGLVKRRKAEEREFAPWCKQ